MDPYDKNMRPLVFLEYPPDAPVTIQLGGYTDRVFAFFADFIGANSGGAPLSIILCSHNTIYGVHV